MVPADCPTEEALLARASGGSGEHDAVDAHLAECSECRIVVSEVARTSRAVSPDDTRREPPPQRPRVAPGDLIDGKYRVDAILGEGGMGLVLGATHEVLGSRVAIKVPSLALRDDPEVRARLLREARMAVHLEGEYVGRVLDAGILAGGFPFVVFELLSGRTLAERVRDDGPLSASEAVDTILEACAGLSKAHAAGIVHRDVKPSNLFEAHRADGTLRVRVIDFGIAKVRGGHVHDGTRSGVVLGTPAYMAPEQTAAARDVDARADIWALGITLVELVTGRPPTVASFAATFADDAGALVREIAEAGTTRRDALAIARVVGRCLRDRADERYGTVEELACALLPFAGVRGREARQSMARSDSLAPAPGLPPRRVLRVTRVVVPAMLVAILAWAAFALRRPPVGDVRVSISPPSVPFATAATATPIVEASPSNVPPPSPPSPPKVVTSARRPPRSIPASTPAPLPTEAALIPGRDVNGLSDRK